MSPFLVLALFGFIQVGLSASFTKREYPEYYNPDYVCESDSCPPGQFEAAIYKREYADYTPPEEACEGDDCDPPYFVMAAEDIPDLPATCVCDDKVCRRFFC